MEIVRGDVKEKLTKDFSTVFTFKLLNLSMNIVVLSSSNMKWRFSRSTISLRVDY